MKTTVLWFFCLGITVAIGSMFYSPAPHNAETTAVQATALVADTEGHGTGVVVGPNLLITAAHVVGTNNSVEITFANGRLATGRVLWSGRPGHDVALVEVTTGNIAPAQVQCRKPSMGERIFTHGYPSGASKVTAWGRVASDVSPAGANIPEGAVMLDLTVIPGDSGGGVWNEHGELIGLVDAVITMPMPVIPFGTGVSLTGLSVMVGGPELCKLLGRI